MSFTNVLDIHVYNIHTLGMTALAEYMNMVNTSCTSLAKRVGCDRSMISKLKTGTATPSLKLALKLAQETGLSVESLFKQTGDVDQ